MSKNNGVPAFPVAGSEHNYPIEGMTLRDHFAAKVMSGDWDAQDSEDIGAFTGDIDEELLIKRAQLYYRMADAMLKARGE